MLLGALGTTLTRAQTYQVLHDFAPPPPRSPLATLIADASGNLYGTTYAGGSANAGAVFKLDASNNYARSMLHSFTGSDGAHPQAGLIADASGNLYGTTYAGGSSGNGTVFKLDASNNYALTTLHDFSGSDGANPFAALLADSSGNLYGTTRYGGASGNGIVFELDASNNYALTTLHDFAGSDGANPQAGLIADSSGNLYGTAAYGGIWGFGRVFKLDASSNYTLTTLHDFFGPDGAYPFAGLMADASGNLYGTTYLGGVQGYGTVFKLDASNAYSFTMLYSFASSDGAYPFAAVIVDSSGNLYGTTQYGGASSAGTVFKLDASAGYALTTLHSFAYSDGANVLAGLIADSSGDLYGTTYEGGASGAGTVFKLDASSGYALTTLDNFAYSEAANPLAALITDASGNLYGTAYQGGGSGNGAVFRLDASNGYALTSLHDFTGSDGGNPVAGLITDSSGNFYGTTYNGGASGYGTVFRLDASNGYALTTLHEFDGSDGANPFAGLISDTAGNLYSTTYRGGASGYGMVFRLDASNGYALSVLHDFAGLDGTNPYAGLIADSSGNLYGTTVYGGGRSQGTVFKLDASNGYALTTLHSFISAEGANPYAGLIADSSGNLYGTTLAGGASGYGTVFKLDASSGYALTTLHAFDGSDGAASYAALIADTAGNLYGTTGYGGSSNDGTIFELDASNGYSLTTLYEFAGSDGANPQAALIADTAGNLYGTASLGGAGGTGVVFRLTLPCSPPTAVASGSATICAGSSTPLSGSGGLSCSWSPATGLSDPSSCNPSASPAATTTYTLTVTDAGFCASTNNPTVTVTVNPTPAPPTITAPSWVVVGATGVVASVPNNSGSTYTWTLSGGTITAGQGSSSILFDAGPAGTTMVLSVMETNSSGCSSPVSVQKVQVDFLDVPPSHPFHDFIDTIARNGVTAGCGGGNFCPADPVTRAQMAVFLLTAEHGAGYTPPACTGIFQDVPCPSGFAVNFIEQLYHEGIAAGCGGGNFCPNDLVTRAQMAVFLLVAEHGSGYTPPACTGIFNDVPCPGGFAVNWIEQLYHEGITAGCGGGNYCPDDPNTRGQMAVFLTKTFGLP